MRVLFDAVHPADVWVLGALDDRLERAGAESLWLSRAGKELVVELVEGRGRPHVVASTAGRRRLGLAGELAMRDWRAWQAVRTFRPDVIVTRSPAGVHAGRLTRTPVLYDTDDGDVAGLLFRVAGPFADVIASPAANTSPLGKEHRRYRGYKELMYLHPDRFEPDPSIRASLGVGEEEPLFIVRLTGFTASHDRGERGFSAPVLGKLVERLTQAGRVVLSSEAPVPPELRHLVTATQAHDFHHLVAASDLVVSDGQTVCSEAAVLGVPSLRFNTWAGRHPYQVELERRWGLTRAFSVDDEAGFLEAVEGTVSDLDAVKECHAERRVEMLEWSSEPLDDLEAWTRELAATGSLRR